MNCFSHRGDPGAASTTPDTRLWWRGSQHHGLTRVVQAVARDSRSAVPERAHGLAVFVQIGLLDGRRIDSAPRPLPAPGRTWWRWRPTAPPMSRRTQRLGGANGIGRTRTRSVAVDDAIGRCEAAGVTNAAKPRYIRELMQRWRIEGAPFPSR